MSSITEHPELAREGIQTRLIEIQAELDRIGNTVGMNKARVSLTEEKNELLDMLLDSLQPA